MKKSRAKRIRKGILLARMDINVLTYIQELKDSTPLQAEDYAKFATYPKDRLTRKAYKRTMEKEADAIASLRQQIEGQS